ncbi:MAG: hypothetical protein CMH55_07070, partial [Myxococcales bacterium]|nr:hypothetical protein [Myxococcales bacterium]
RLGLIARLRLIAGLRPIADSSFDRRDFIATLERLKSGGRKIGQLVFTLEDQLVDRLIVDCFHLGCFGLPVTIKSSQGSGR